LAVSIKQVLLSIYELGDGRRLLGAHTHEEKAQTLTAKSNTEGHKEATMHRLYN